MGSVRGTLPFLFLVIFGTFIGRGTSQAGDGVPSGRIRTHIKQTDTVPVGRAQVDPIPKNASFGVEYKGTVLRRKEYIYTFVYKEVVNKTTAMRVRVTSPNATAAFPVVFVVRQQRGILSWQVPLFLENIYDYYTVSRTLCPVQDQDKTSPEQQEAVVIEVSSFSKKPINFMLNASLVPSFELMTGRAMPVDVSPSEPKYFEYTFPDDVQSVLVRVTSLSSICSVVSVQDINCPVFDLDRNVEFTGVYQTMTKNAGLTVRRKDYKGGKFFVVLVVKTGDYECTGYESVFANVSGSGRGNSRFDRIKKATITVNKTISADQYYSAIFGAVAWFILFYIFSFIMSVAYYVKEKNQQPDQEMLTEPHDSESLLARSAAASNNVNTDYGATRGADYSEFGKDSNGIPHRIPPREDADSDDDVDVRDVDMLHDAHYEPDVYMTKTPEGSGQSILYLSDLSRKDKAVLSKKYKLYYWNLITISIFYGLPVAQLVITYQTVLHVTGNEDICYYNFYCANPLGVISSFNNVFSNVGYIMLGLLFLLLVWRREVVHRKAVEQNEHLDKSLGVPQHFGLFYAMGIALVMEGVLSGCYHVCPSYSNFQFDTSFMYMIAWLSMLKIYQTRHPDINAASHTAYFALAFVIFLAVIGVVYGNMAFWILFTIVHILATLTLSAQIYYVGRVRIDGGLFKRVWFIIRSDFPHCTKPLYPDRMILLIMGNLVNWSFALFGLITQPRDFASYLLAIFIINLLLYCAFYIILKLRSSERILHVPLLFIVLATIVWGFAFYFFKSKLTSWEVTPAMSREGNHPCILLNFYDEHDIWHFLSAMSMFFSFMILLTLDDDLIYTPRERIPVF